MSVKDNKGLLQAPVIDRTRLLQNCEAIEAALQVDQFEECAFLLSELMSYIRQHFEDHFESQNPDGTKVILRAQDLLTRCREQVLTNDSMLGNRLRDDIRNGLILLLSDVVESERFQESLRV